MPDWAWSQGVTRVIAACAIILSIGLGAAAVIMAESVAQGNQNNSDLISKRNITIDALNDSEAQNVCVSRLQAEFDQAIGRAVVAPSDSQEQKDAIAALEPTVERLSQIDTVCFAAHPLPSVPPPTR